MIIKSSQGCLIWRTHNTLAVFSPHFTPTCGIKRIIHCFPPSNKGLAAQRASAFDVVRLLLIWIHIHWGFKAEKCNLFRCNFFSIIDEYVYSELLICRLIETKNKPFVNWFLKKSVNTVALWDYQNKTKQNQKNYFFTWATATLPQQIRWLCGRGYLFGQPMVVEICWETCLNLHLLMILAQESHISTFLEKEVRGIFFIWFFISGLFFSNMCESLLLWK